MEPANRPRRPAPPVALTQSEAECVLAWATRVKGGEAFGGLPVTGVRLRRSRSGALVVCPELEDGA